VTVDRFTLSAVTVCAVLAACVAATWIPGAYTPGPVLTWACAYTAAVLGLARVVGLPPARTLYAATLLVVAAVRVVLVGVRHVVDGLLGVLARLAVAGTAGLSQKADAA
jgi:hypothetical protein